MMTLGNFLLALFQEGASTGMPVKFKLLNTPEARVDSVRVVDGKIVVESFESVVPQMMLADDCDSKESSAKIPITRPATAEGVAWRL